MRVLKPQLSASPITPELQQLMAAGYARAEREQVQRACITRLAQQIPTRQVQLPLKLHDDFRRAQLQALGELLDQGFRPNA
jgi:hypothetical protein